MEEILDQNEDVVDFEVSFERINQLREEALGEAKKEIENLINQLPEHLRAQAREDVKNGKIPIIKTKKSVDVVHQKVSFKENQ